MGTNTSRLRDVMLFNWVPYDRLKHKWMEKMFGPPNAEYRSRECGQGSWRKSERNHQKGTPVPPTGKSNRTPGTSERHTAADHRCLIVYYHFIHVTQSQRQFLQDVSSCFARSLSLSHSLTLCPRNQNRPTRLSNFTSLGIFHSSSSVSNNNNNKEHQYMWRMEKKYNSRPHSCRSSRHIPFPPSDSFPLSSTLYWDSVANKTKQSLVRQLRLTDWLTDWLPISLLFNTLLASFFVGYFSTICLLSHTTTYMHKHTQEPLGIIRRQKQQLRSAPSNLWKPYTRTEAPPPSSPTELIVNHIKST